jgi:hypothetical protein
MAHKKRRVGDKRRHGGGRRYDPHAKRRFTTRFGRKYGYERPDLGSERLRQKKLALTSRSDTEMTAAGVLYGFGYLDNAQYTKLGVITQLLRNVQMAMGKGSLSVAGIWTALVDRSHTRITSLPLLGDRGASRQLSRICRELDGCKSLVIELAAERTVPPLVIRAVQHCLEPADLVMLETLRKGLDTITVRSREPD